MRNDFCSNYLEHSAKGTTWSRTVHKYIKKVWKNGKWIYYYPITGKGYLRDAENYKRQAIDSDRISKTAEKRGNKKAARIEEEHASRMINKSLYSQTKYRSRSLAGIIEKGKKRISRMLYNLTNPKVTVTTTHKITPRNPDAKVGSYQSSEKKKPKEPKVPSIQKVPGGYKVGAKHFKNRDDAKEYQYDNWGKAHDEWEKKYGGK